jgi:hypothetical protein
MTKRMPGYNIIVNGQKMRMDDIRRDAGTAWTAADGSVWIVVGEQVRTSWALGVGWAHTVREATDSEIAALADETEVDWDGFFEATSTFS